MLLSLSVLKTHLMPSAASSRTEKDDAIELIGKGVTAKFENFTNRKFSYLADDTFRVSARNLSVCVPRFPIIGSPTVSLQPLGGGTVVDITDTIITVDPESGLIGFGQSVPGLQDDRLLITYTGGYWVPTGEEGDTQPEGSTEIPDDLKMAFIEQVRSVCDAQRLFQTGSMGAEKDNSRVISREIKMLDDVKEVLGQYRRFA